MKKFIHTPLTEDLNGFLETYCNLFLFRVNNNQQKLLDEVICPPFSSSGEEIWECFTFIKNVSSRSMFSRNMSRRWKSSRPTRWLFLRGTCSVLPSSGWANMESLTTIWEKEKETWTWRDHCWMMKTITEYIVCRWIQVWYCPMDNDKDDRENSNNIFLE